MKYIFVSISLLFALSCTESAINDNNNQPDNQFINIVDNNLKNAIINSNVVDTNNDGIADSDADTNDDGEIDINEALAVEKFIFSPNTQTLRVADLTGIEQFTNLKHLSFGWIYFGAIYLNNEIITPENINPDFTNLTKLEFLEFNHANSDFIKTINLTNLSNLLELRLINIRPLVTDNIKHTKVEIDGCTALKKLNCMNSFLNINFCKIPQLENLDYEYLEGGEKLEGKNVFDFSCLTNLKYLNIRENFIEKLILKNTSVLETLIADSLYYTPDFICIDNDEKERKQVEGIFNLEHFNNSNPNNTVSSITISTTNCN